MYESYYRILSVNENATADEIRRAYRIRAKELHPDVNKSPDAHQQFILLGEAYEFLYGLKTGKTYNQRSRSYSSSFDEEEWKRKQQEEARERAQRYAKMKYEEFMNSDYYKSTVSLVTLFDFGLLFVGFLTWPLPLIGLFLNGWRGFFIGLLIAGIFAPAWLPAFRKKEQFEKKIFFSALNTFVKTKTFLFVFVLGANLILFFTVTMNTILPTRILFLLLFIIFLGAGTLVLVRRKKWSSYLKILVLIGWTPGIPNLFFLTNSVFANQPVSKTYTFKTTDKNGDAHFLSFGGDAYGFIFLENDTYSDAHWTRLFFLYRDLSDYKYVKYHTETGLFGIPVVRSTVFFSDEDPEVKKVLDQLEEEKHGDQGIILPLKSR